MLLITRPKPKLAASVAAFESVGLAVVGVAPFDIQPQNEVREKLQETLSQRVNKRLLIATSKFAADALVDCVRDVPCHTPVVAVGLTTKQALANCFSHVITPHTSDSEGILALAELEQVNCESAIVIKGVGGRDLIETQLAERGIQVIVFNVYQRTKLNPVYSSAKWQWQDVTGIIATSGEMALALIEQYGFEQVKSKPWLTVSKRVATLLNQQGISAVQVCSGASDPLLIEWVKENWE